MTTYEWSVIRDKCVEWFGDTPSKPTELAIVTVFKERPAAVIRELQTIAGLVSTGEARSGWALARHRIARLDAIDAVATDTSEREDAVRRALAWVRGAGRHYDRESEVVDELYGDRGPLRLWPDTRETVLEEWRRHVEAPA